VLFRPACAKRSWPPIHLGDGPKRKDLKDVTTP